jgi:hypothetical protein
MVVIVSALRMVIPTPQGVYLLVEKIIRLRCACPATHLAKTAKTV